MRTFIQSFAIAFICLVSSVGVFAAEATDAPLKQFGTVAPIITETPEITETAKQSWKERMIEKVVAKKVAKMERKARVSQDGERKTHWANITSIGLIAGIVLDLALIGSGLALLFGIAAIVFGAIGMKNSGEDKEFSGKGMGIAGLVAGIVTVFLYILLIAVVISLFA